MVEDNLDWFAKLLHEATDANLKLNEANCVGTVLALNGPRKSFSLYHASQMQPRSSDAGAFLGFADDDADVILDSELLSGLGAWLERLCEGTVTKYKISEWPTITQ